MKHSPRIKGRVVYLPVGRLVANFDLDAVMDSAEKILEFTIPSTSRGKKTGRAYHVEADLLSLEVACACEAGSRHYEHDDDEQGFREAHKMPYRFENAASPLEATAKAHGITMLPTVTRAPRGLCPHARKVRSWLHRHGMAEYCRLREEELMERFTRSTTPDRRSA